jgi:hypothetical protein
VPIHPSPRPAVVAALLLSMVAPSLLSGCRQSREALADSAIGHAASPLKAASDNDRVASGGHVETLAMQQGETLPLPADFPDDVYLPRDYRINSVMDRGGLRVISLQAPGRVPGLFGAARDAMDRHGWKQTLAMQDATDNAVLTYEKDRRAAVLSFNSGGGVRGVTMSVQLRGERQ